MCGIAVMCGQGWSPESLDAMAGSLAHRGPDGAGRHLDLEAGVGLAHTRLSILDLSEAGRQPMSDPDGRWWITFNGEIYNYLELRAELEGDWTFQTGTDTEVLLAAFRKWGENCLKRLIGMFAFAVWDAREKTLFAARDRFGVKPLYIATRPDGMWLASEIKALHAAGLARVPHAQTWASYLVSGVYDHSEETFWAGVRQLSPGGWLRWSPRTGIEMGAWYDVARAALESGPDSRPDEAVGEELLALLEGSVRLRFRADVPVGVCLSGGLDSSLLLGLVHRVRGAESDIKTFTFYCGDAAYDEIPWVEQMLAQTKHPASFCLLQAGEVPSLARWVQQFQDEPFGGVPTLGMARVHQRAREENVTVLLDGNGMDEGWAGYEYYQRAGAIDAAAGPVQGARSRSTRPDCLDPHFARAARDLEKEAPFASALANLQYRDIRRAKIPRAMRFADRVSMMFSRELREPFLDHRVLELGLRQPSGRLIRGEQGKWLPRQVAARLLPSGVREAPKRAVQTPQREWLRGPLAGWVSECLDLAMRGWGGAWLNPKAVRAAWKEYQEGGVDNSFMIWQWISLGLMSAD